MLTDSFLLLLNNQMFVGNMQTTQKLSWGQGLFWQQVSKAKMIYFIVSGLLAKCNWQLMHIAVCIQLKYRQSRSFLDITYEIVKILGVAWHNNYCATH